MEFARTKPSCARIGTLLLTASLIAALSACSSGSGNVADANVARVINAGMVEVSREDGDKQTIVLAGLDVPDDEAGRAPDCLHAESEEFVRASLPSGAAVEVRFVSDEVAKESTAAGTVVLTGGVSLGEALMREGLAVPTAEDAPGADTASFRAAQEVARSAEAGLYSDQIACTVPGQVAALGAEVNCAAVQTQVSQSTTVSTSSSSTATAAPVSTGPAGFSATVAASGSAGIAEQVRAAASLVGRATNLQLAMVQDADAIIWRALNEAQRLSCSTFINDAVVFAVRDHDNLSAALLVAQQQEAEAARVAEEQRIAAEVEAARVAEEQRVAAEAEAARVAEEQRLAAEAEAARVAAEQQAAADAEAARAAAAQEAEAQRRAAAAAAAQQSSSNSSGGSGGNPSSGSPGSPSTYTGPRCYAPGGQTWRPC